MEFGSHWMPKRARSSPFMMGDRSKESARQLWDKIPDAYRKHATFHTDIYDSYVDIIPPEQHRRVTKQTGLTNSIERFNCTMRQRVSRLVRDSLAFSKKLTNHIGSIHYFICHYNQTRKLAALHM
jgi:insertion element IS1 protein InsB